MFNWGRSKKDEPKQAEPRRERLRRGYASQSGRDFGILPRKVIQGVEPGRHLRSPSFDSINTPRVGRVSPGQHPIQIIQPGIPGQHYVPFPSSGPPTIIHGSPRRRSSSLDSQRTGPPVVYEQHTDALFSRDSPLLDVKLVPETALPRLQFKKIELLEENYIAYLSDYPWSTDDALIYRLTGEQKGVAPPCSRVSNSAKILLHPTKPVVLYTEGTLKVLGQGLSMQTVVALDVDKARVVSVTPFPNTYMRVFCWINDTTVLIGVGGSAQQGCEFCLLNVLEGSPMRKTDMRSLPEKNLVNVMGTSDAEWVAYEAHTPMPWSSGHPIAVSVANGSTVSSPRLIVAALRTGIRPCKMHTPAVWCLVSRGSGSTRVGTLVWVTSVSRSSAKVHIAEPAVDDDTVVLMDIREMILPDARFHNTEGCARTIDRLGLVVILCSNSLHVLDIERASLIHSLRLNGGSTDSPPYGTPVILTPQPTIGSWPVSEWQQAENQARESERKATPAFMAVVDPWSTNIQLESISSSGTILLRRRTQQPQIITVHQTGERYIDDPNRRYYHLKIKEDVLVPYIRQKFPHDRALAMAIAGRAGLPGAEDLWIRSYPN